MERWALSYGEKASFICVGCAGPGLAAEMGTQMRLKNCVNSFIAKQSEMPRWGQLGCNGFIILDGDQEIVSEGTTAYLQVKELAFKHVEALLDAVIEGRPLPKVCPGQFVRLQGLENKPKLNGQIAICVAGEKNGRCTLQLMQNRKQLSVKPSNLVVVNQEGIPQETNQAGKGG